MAEQYRVDLSELDAVVRSLNNVLRAMERTKGKARHQTYLPEGALGSGFSEADNLRAAHNDMKEWLEALTEVLEDLIDRYGKNTSTVMGNYQNTEYEHTSAFGLN